jgi:5-phospho-D-xylono-1,4-lactonase
MKIQTITGLLKKEDFKIIDSHLHLWINKDSEYLENINFLRNYELVKNQLIEYKDFGGNGLVDCTPYGCGRDGNILKKLFLDTNVNIISVTGFHKEIYYDPHFFIWKINMEEAEAFFISEIKNCLFECKDTGNYLKAGVIKIPFIGILEGSYLRLTLAAIRAAIKTGAPLLVHTEQGLNIEDFADFIEKYDVNPKKVLLCHLDKRNDLSLHISLAQRGYYLEYDTFLRPKYKPDKNLWPLLEKMILKGYEDSIIIGSDIYGDDMWKELSQNGGLQGFFNSIIQKLDNLKVPRNIIAKIIGINVSNFLSF